MIFAVDVCSEGVQLRNPSLVQNDAIDSTQTIVVMEGMGYAEMMMMMMMMMMTIVKRK
jgi:hypothetical protein